MRVHYFERVSSTMDLLHELASGGADAGTAVVAGEQLQGRGSRGQTWHSSPGGIWLSVLFRPLIIEALEVVSLRVGLIVAEAVQPLIPEPLQLKWPNDVMLGSRKVGGVLCEARWQGDALAWVAVGVGINVRNVIPAELGPQAVALSAHAPEITVDDVYAVVLPAVRRLDPDAGQLSAAELKRFAGRDWLRGRTIREPIAGRVQGLSPDGTLLVQSASGLNVPLRSGPIELGDFLTTGDFDHVARSRHR
ncbi:MAG TPA: biotin--[acetyl-CoA-carboxylase] ligase [Gemmatimonadales bacterium]|nr:biotin--[acetyl-CoA-carboxylase] ligase [Gemmatimonadales bacterium]